jgi:hypothetical protein
MSTEGFDKLDTLLRERSYQELTEKERAFIDKEIGGEKAFNELKAMAMQLSGEQKVAINPSVKTDLMRNFKRKHRSVFLTAAEYKTPFYLNIAASVVLAVVIYWLMPAKRVEVIKTVTEQLPPRIDTLTVQMPADTVYIRETIKVNVPVYVAANETKEENKVEISGSTLKDQKALMDLLSETSPD